MTLHFMAFQDLLITEIFHSLQGETSLSGVPFAFIRLTGCNLRCTYCDSSYSFKGGRKMSIEDVLRTIKPYKVKHVLLTGGEPLLQRQTPALLERLRSEGYLVSIETHGEISIEKVAGQARIILDIKTPSSGMSRGGYKNNLPLLRKNDEVKFVIASESDYAWAREIILAGEIPTAEILLSPAVPSKGMPGNFPGVNPRWLAEKILEDRLPVRMQLQLHKLLWGADQKGV
jgi:7-carboxy-7-deazaguanine synthase